MPDSAGAESTTPTTLGRKVSASCLRSSRHLLPIGSKEDGEDGAPVPKHHADVDRSDCGTPEADAFEAAKRRAGLGFSPPQVGALVLTNTLLGGSGMLGIPHALSVSGYVLGFVLLALSGCASALGSHLLHCVARRVGRAPCSFYTVTSAVAPRWAWLIDSAVMVKCFGVGTSYLIIVGDLVPDAARYFGAGQVLRWQSISAAFAIAGALACFRNLSALRFTAMASLLIAAWTATLIGLFFLRLGPAFEPCIVPADKWAEPIVLDLLPVYMQSLPCAGADFTPFPTDLGALGKVLPVFIFGFTCQQNIFTLCNEVKDASEPRIDRILCWSYLLSGLAFASAALFGYATYGDKVQSDVLKGYPRNAVVEFTRLLFSFVAVSSYPLQAHPSRNSALALLHIVRPLRGCVEGDAEYSRVEARRFWAVTMVGLSLSYAAALCIEDLGNILAIVGATGSTTVSYILPGIVYLRAFPGWRPKRVLALCLFGTGCLIMPMCLALVVI